MEYDYGLGFDRSIRGGQGAVSGDYRWSMGGHLALACDLFSAARNPYRPNAGVQKGGRSCRKGGQVTLWQRLRALAQVLGACKALDAMRDTLRDHEQRLNAIEERDNRK